jgi:hypothetical protein
MPPPRRQLAKVLAWAPVGLALVGAPMAAAEDSFGPLGPANVFISPCGKPFRAKVGDPYPVAAWFKEADTNGDGKIDHAEFVADSLAFFKRLDRNGDGLISPQEVAWYEERIAPEVLGMRVEIDSRGVGMSRPLVWKTQGMPGGGRPGAGVDPGGGDGDETQHSSRPYDASGQGAAPYGFFVEPEPVTAADTGLRGLVSKEDFVRQADVHFRSLDASSSGVLTLATLPMTSAQRRLARTHRQAR